MNEILKAPFMEEMAETAANMYRLGWDERNGGNISMIVTEKEASPYLELSAPPLRKIPLGFDASPLAGTLFLVTGTGKYFKNVKKDPKQIWASSASVRTGAQAELLWGYKDGGRFTSELPAHLMSHMARLSVDPEHKVVIHSHPTNTLAMNFVHTLDEREFTRTLWQMCTECILGSPRESACCPGCSAAAIPSARPPPPR